MKAELAGGQKLVDQFYGGLTSLATHLQRIYCIKVTELHTKLSEQNGN